MLAVEIYYYGVGAPISIPMTGSDRAVAESYFERLKKDVIEAQQHSQRQLLIHPFDPTQDAQVVRPWEIQRVVLVDRPPTTDVAHAVPPAFPQPPDGVSRDAAAQDASPRTSPVRESRLAPARPVVAI
ncbi:MAG: hypothetical protein ACR2I7_03305, partial [Geodermatophilaceae bacterium]